MFLIKIVQKITGNQKAGKKQSKNSREIRERKDKTKEKESKSKKVFKEICQRNFERKRFIRLSKVETRF